LKFFNFLESLIEYEEFYPELANPKKIFDPIESKEYSLLENIQSMNKLNNQIISNEFYKLFVKFEKPKISFWDIVVFVWTNIGGAFKLMACLMSTSLLLGSKTRINL
jgi:hypothetical protein